METLTFQTIPIVTIATNKFINVPIILRYEDINLIEIIKELGIGFTTQIPIFHSDGTKLAIVKGNRIFKTKDGEKAGIKLDYPLGMTICSIDNRTIFELHHQTGESFKANAELFTNDGYFVKCSDSPNPNLIDTKGNAIKIGGLTMSNNTFVGSAIGIWLRKNGSCAMGVNL